MTLGLEEFLKELRAEEGVNHFDFEFHQSSKGNWKLLKLYIYFGDRDTELDYIFHSDPTENYHTKFPKSFASTLKQIKKEIKNQSKS
jgi:hypothetical protein